MSEFYLRLHIGRGKDYIEVEVQADGELRYTNQSSYRGEEAIRKRLYVSPTVLGEIERIARGAQVTAMDDAAWPSPDGEGRQELEVRMAAGAGEEDGNGGAVVEHVSLATTKLASTVQIARCGGGGSGGGNVTEGLRRYFFLCQDLKALFLALVAAHFQVQPI